MNTKLISCILLISAISLDAQASNYPAVECTGCTNVQMAAKAANATDEGFVFVFNKFSKQVKKYEVITEVISARPYQEISLAAEHTVNRALKDAFKEFVEAENALQNDPNVLLPPDSPFETVAGAFNDPAYFRAYLAQNINEITPFSLKIERFFEAWANNLLSASDFNGLADKNTITVEFKNGSTLVVKLTYYSEAGEWGIEPISETAKMADGSLFPQSPAMFNGFEYSGTPNAVNEFIKWARNMGVPVTEGSATGGAPGKVDIWYLDCSGNRCVWRKF